MIEKEWSSGTDCVGSERSCGLPMDSVTLWLLAACAGLAVSGIALWCCRRFEVGVFLLTLSPWVSAVFVSNSDTTDVVDLDSTSAGSYLRIGLLFMLGIVGAIQ